MDKEQKTPLSEKLDDSTGYFPGASIDVADDEKVDETMVDNRTKAQNDNPRDNDLF